MEFELIPDYDMHLMVEEIPELEMVHHSKLNNKRKCTKTHRRSYPFWITHISTNERVSYTMKEFCTMLTPISNKGILYLPCKRFNWIRSSGDIFRILEK